jgi:hypothetical protein
MSNNNSVPGLMRPTQIGFQPGAGTPRESAMENMKQNNQLQAQASNSLSGGRLRKRKAYGGGNTLTVSQFTMPYPETSGFGTGVNSQVKGISQTSTQMDANAALDKVGGSKRRGSSKRRSRKGGNPDWVWGCMSGGKKRRTRKNSRKNKKSRKNRRSRKN